MLWSVVLIAVVLMLGGRSVGAANVSATALSIPPSTYFDGDDGFWSTFRIEVGTPSQSVLLLPGTSAFAGTTIWVVLAEGCWEANPGLDNCANERGGVFTRNESTSWSTQRLSNDGLYQLNTHEEQFLGLTGSAYYGFDTVELGTNGGGLPTLQSQLVAGIATDNFFVGSLGLSPLSFNISDLNNPVPSLLGNLRNQSIVPSSSWAYTAGAFYQSPPAYGSLTFGGYDETRLDANNILNNISFSGDPSRDLQVQLQTITYNTLGSSPLLVDSIYLFIDSMVSQLWLPTTVCQSFEQAFNLTWNSTLSLYLIDETVHSTLLAQNPVFTFTIGSGDGSGTVDIVLPYAAFDLNVSAPILNGTSRYFPLQRADNSSQYTLGRVFLQEAYVVADYDRHNFSVSQARFPPAALSPQLITICAPGNEAACKPRGDASLSGGAIAGIAVGAVAVILIIAAGLGWLLWRRRKARAKVDEPSYTVDEKREEPPQSKPLLPESELENSEAALYEMDQQNSFRPEMGDGAVVKAKERPREQRHEMASPEIAAFELEAPVPRSDPK